MIFLHFLWLEMWKGLYLCHHVCLCVFARNVYVCLCVYVFVPPSVIPHAYVNMWLFSKLPSYKTTLPLVPKLFSFNTPNRILVIWCCHIFFKRIWRWNPHIFSSDLPCETFDFYLPQNIDLFNSAQNDNRKSNTHQLMYNPCFIDYRDGFDKICHNEL